MRNFDSGRKTVEDEPAHFRFENRNQICELAQILISAMNGSGKMALQGTSDGQHLIAAGMPHKKRGGPEDFCVQI